MRGDATAYRDVCKVSAAEILVNRPTERSQAFRHEEFKLLLGENTDVFSDALPAWILHALLLWQARRIDPVRQAIRVLDHIALYVQQPLLVVPLGFPSIRVPSLLLGGVEGAAGDLVEEGRIRFGGIIMTNA